MSQQNIANAAIEENIQQILDHVAETGVPVTVKRKGKILMISCAGNGFKMDRLEEHPDFLQGDPEDVVHMDWSGKWNPTL
jgi:hypothetical protein